MQNFKKAINCCELCEVTIGKDVIFNKNHYKVVIHGALGNHKYYPHIHILDNYGFDVEVSLIDILVKDKIFIQTFNHLLNGRKKLKDDFEDWLYEKPKGLPGEWQNNLEAIIWYCNHESPNENYVREYIESRGLKVLEKFENLM